VSMAELKNGRKYFVSCIGLTLRNDLHSSSLSDLICDEITMNRVVCSVGIFFLGLTQFATMEFSRTFAVFQLPLLLLKFLLTLK